MKIKFWGVRGSIPTPGKNFSKFGGNTSCVELSVNNRSIIFDMGSGIVNLGNHIIKNNIKKFDILLSHFHYDHTCGLPFFKPAFNKDYKFTIRSGIEKTRSKTLEVLKKQISSPSFPITVKEFSANIKYCDFKIGRDFYIDKLKVKTILLNHPNGAVGYRVQYKKKAICYITDHEHDLKEKNKNLLKFLHNADVLIYDSTYDDRNFKNFVGWGHSTWQEATRLANECNIKKLFIFHHNPDNNDKKMDYIEAACKKISNNFLVAKEGMFINIK